MFQTKLFSRLTKFSILEITSERMTATVIESGPSASAVPLPKCLFCAIIKDNEPGKIVYQDEEIVAFADIKPASKCHYLIVPKRHLVDAKHLTSADKSLVEKLIVVGRKVLEQQQADLTNARFGFHWPPFHTISHLHLHAISPVSQMNFIGRLIFRPDSYWFVSPEYVLSRL